MKNLNSFKAIARAIENERERQIELLEEGRPVVQETRRWDDNKEYSYAMRSKEDAKDYRYFPDPDLPPVYIDEAWLTRTKESLPEMQEEKADRYMESFGLTRDDAQLLTDSRNIAGIFEKTVELGATAKKTANWLTGETIRLARDASMDLDAVSFAPEHLAALIRLSDEGKLNNQNARKVFEAIFKEDVDPEAYMEANGLKTVMDTGLLETVVARVLEENPKTVEEYKSGKTKVLGFLVGQVMKQMKGKADPGSVNRMLKERL